MIVLITDGAPMIDYKFELQYTISLFIMIFAAITAGFHTYILSYAAFFAVGILQLVVLTTKGYAKQSLHEIVSSRYGDTALDITTILFSAVSVLVISEQILFALTRNTIARLLIPFPVAFLVSIPLLSTATKSRYWRRIAFSLSPEVFRIYDKYIDDSVTLYIKNKAVRKTSFSVDISIPIGTKMKIDGGEDIENSYEEKLNLDPGKEVVHELYFRHDGGKNESLILTVELKGAKSSVVQSTKLIKR